MILTNDEQDVLRELLNIAYGSATASISQILDAFATLHIPKITMIESKDLKAYISTNSKGVGDYLGIQTFNGDISGQSIFLIDESSAINLTKHLYDNDISSVNIEDSVLELTNILSSAIISNLSSNFKTHINFMAPLISTLSKTDILTKEKLEKYNNVIIVSTKMEFQEIDILGEVILILDDKSIEKVKLAINNMLENLQ